MDIKELNLKKNRLIMQEKGKKLKYGLLSINTCESYTLYLCKKYRWIHPVGGNSSLFEAIHAGFAFKLYMETIGAKFPFKYEINHIKNVAQMCILVFRENNKITKILDHHEAIEYFDSIKLCNVLIGNKKNYYTGPTTTVFN